MLARSPYCVNLKIREAVEIRKQQKETEEKRENKIYMFSAELLEENPTCSRDVYMEGSCMPQSLLIQDCMSRSLLSNLLFLRNIFL